MPLYFLNNFIITNSNDIINKKVHTNTNKSIRPKGTLRRPLRDPVHEIDCKCHLIYEVRREQERERAREHES